MIDTLLTDPALIIILAGAGILAGLLAGLLGVGGGFLFAPAGYVVLLSLGIPKDTALLTAFGVSLAAAFPTVLTGALAHTRQGNVSWKTAAVMGLTGMVFGFAGGFAAAALPVDVLTILFSLILILGGIRMLTKLPSGDKTSIPSPLSAVIGACGGFFSGLLGVGGGTILVPLMTIFGKLPMKRAAAVSSAAIVFITAGGLTSYLLHGYFDITLWVILIITAVPAAYISAAKLSGKIPEKVLRILFFILMTGIAAKMIFDVFAG
ncbi:MAG TPA: sulfite exporter TauE/SafE family protein [Methanocorpusculum sp.]|nr:sulfite exporter TauE/SafE family protein [Methanocorpusculum sp.]